MESEQYLTVKQAAQRLQLSTKTIHRWIASGKLRGLWAGSDRAGWRIRSSDVDNALETERPAYPTPQPRLPLQERAPKKLVA